MVSHFEAMPQCVTTAIEKNNEKLMLSCIYGATTCVRRRDLWGHLCYLKQFMNHIPWACMGDYNTYVATDEKIGGAGPNFGAMEDFITCLDACSLLDLGFMAQSIHGVMDRSRSVMIGAL